MKSQSYAFRAAAPSGADSSIAVISLAHPPANETARQPWGTTLAEHRIFPDMMSELERELDACFATTEVRAVVIRNEGTTSFGVPSFTDSSAPCAARTGADSHCEEQSRAPNLTWGFRISLSQASFGPTGST